MEEKPGVKKWGFAAMSPERHREVSRMGGTAAQAMGKGHQFTPEEARIAGRKGGLRSPKRKAEQA